MTGLTIGQFDHFYATNYTFLKREVNKYADDDLLHDVYISLRMKITGITITSNVMGYFLRSLKNSFINSLNKQPVLVDIEQVTHYEDDFSNNQEYYNQLDNYSRYLFRFVEQRYNEKQQHVYKSYYLTEKATYKEIAERTGYSYSTVEQYVQKINRDIKSNFNIWLKKEQIKEQKRNRLRLYSD
ncbi:hypothetical protein WSM22_03520 [Cytophagales bacterium WSM2-2]|nr:hypothetical protein WSM22_03520 [Cytophagales bacterium WSM2-2]